MTVYRIPTPSAGWAPWLTWLGETLASAPRGATLLLEQDSTNRQLFLVPSSPALAHRMTESTPFAPLSTEEVPALVAIPPGSSATFGVLDWASSTRGDRTGPGLQSPPSGVGARVQAHLVSDGRGHLELSVRWLARTAEESLSEAFGLSLARSLGQSLGEGFRVRIVRRRGALRREFAGGRLRHLRSTPGVALAPGKLPAVVAFRVPAPFPPRATVVFGASGSGKTSFLARSSAESIRRGESTLVFDFHGDLGPGLFGILPEAERRRVVVLDASRPETAGLQVLDGTVDARSGSWTVAAVRRLSGDGGETYWGFRLERLFDSFVRLVQEEGGSLVDLYDLLTDPGRRETARLTTRSETLARFLDELGPIVRRNPEFLWPAAARLSKVVLDPSIRRLLAPDSPGVPVDGLLGNGRSLLVRLPLSAIGPETATFAATMLLARIYLGRIAGGRESMPVRLFVDEVEYVAPGLIAEIVNEGRKFGFHLVLSTQSPDRLSPELEAALAASATDSFVFRVASTGAPSLARWAGVDQHAAVEWCSNLATGTAIRHRLDSSDPAYSRTEAVPSDEAAVALAVRYTSEEFGGSFEGPPGVGEDGASEALLLTVVAREGTASSPTERELIQLTHEATGLAPELLSQSLGRLYRRSVLRIEDERVVSTPGTLTALGAAGPTGASSESAEHRALLMEAFRVFARHRLRLEIVRQGRFDTRLPDARLELMAERLRAGSPVQLARLIDQRRESWAWRFFQGKNVYVEAEVSGAERPERIRRGLEKARKAGAYALFLVADARRARLVRRVFAADGIPNGAAGVWTLARAMRCRVPRGPSEAI